MSGAVKKVTEAKGHDVTEHLLSVFGGAGPQHGTETFLCIHSRPFPGYSKVVWTTEC